MKTEEIMDKIYRCRMIQVEFPYIGEPYRRLSMNVEGHNLVRIKDVYKILNKELSKKEAKGNVPLASPRRKGRPNIGVCASSRLPARLKKERD